MKNNFIENYGKFTNIQEIGMIVDGLYLGYDRVSEKYFVIGGQGKPDDEILVLDKIMKDPYLNMTDEQIDSLPITDSKHEEFMRYSHHLRSLSQEAKFSLYQVQELVTKVQKAGYNQEEDGHLMFWLMEKIYQTFTTYKQG